MSNKDQVLLEQIYDSIRKPNVLNESISQDEANGLSQGFNMLPGEQKKHAFAKLKSLIGKKVSLSRPVKVKQSTGYGRDDGSATVPGSGGSVAHTETESESGVFALGVVQDVKVSQGQKDYSLNNNLILTINDKDYNLNQGTTVTINYLD